MKDNKHSQLATSFQAFRHRLMMYMWPRMTTHTYSATKHEHKAHPRTYAWKDAWIQRKQFHSCFSLFCSPSVNPLSIIKEKSKDLIQFNELWGIQHSITQTSTFHLVHSDSRTRACIKPQISSGSSHQAPLLPFWALAAESQGASLLRTDVWATVWQLWATCEQQFAHRRVSNSVTVVSNVWATVCAPTCEQQCDSCERRVTVCAPTCEQQFVGTAAWQLFFAAEMREAFCWSTYGYFRAQDTLPSMICPLLASWIWPGWRGPCLVTRFLQKSGWYHDILQSRVS